MANNRMQLYCQKCLELRIIAKYYPTQWYCNNEAENPIHEFLVTHSKQCWEEDPEADHMGGEKMFGFRTENEDDGYISDYGEKPYKLIPNSDLVHTKGQ